MTISRDGAAGVARRLRLRVCAGPQDGAAAPLEPGTLLSVGRASTNDVVLRGPGIAGRHLLLSVDAAGRVRIDAVGAEVRVGDERLDPGGTVELDACDGPIGLGDAAFVVEEFVAVETSAAAVADGSDETGGGATPDDPVPGSDAGIVPHGTGTGAVRATSDATAPAAAPRRGRVLGALVAALAVVGLVGTLLAVAEAPPLPPRPLAAQLEDGFPGLSLARENGIAVVTGHVATRRESIRLDRWLARRAEPVVRRVGIESVLGERVVETLRVNGVEARLVSVDGDAVAVEAGIGDVARLERVRTLVERDVRALASLEIRDTGVPPAAVAAAEPEPPPDPGKRVALVVADEPAYIVTEDRSRYFLGALLPSGHRIASIEPGRVVLEKGGVATELAF